MALTFDHSTVTQLRQRARQRYLTATGREAVRIGAALSTLTNVQLATVFGLANPSAQLTALRQRVDQQAQRKADVLAEVGQ
ncbi:MAG TPA: hypothetical protein VEC14_10435 [Reyranellaceae bacterium]|nr:hypothetical protein [Reyranellaceae bacterium]